MPNARLAQPDRYPLRTLLKVAVRSEVIREVWRNFRGKVGLATVKALGIAAVYGLITYYVAHQGAGVTFATGALVAIVVAFASFVWMLVVAVGDLELRFGQSDETVGVLQRKIGAHLAIFSWVTNCEASLADRGQPQPARERAGQELGFLEANVINSLSPYAFYPSSHVEQVKAIAVGEPGDDAFVRLERLLAYLRKQLAAGAYLL